LLWRDDSSAQFLLGAAASALQPLAVLFLLLNLGVTPLLGWKSLWQWLIMAAGGGAFTPVLFACFNRIRRAFEYQPASQSSSFRPDREIKRGRS
jgi:hypothetical protein